MYVKELRNPEEFIKAIEGSRAEVRVGERAVALPTREHGAVLVRAALERHYVANVRDDLQGATRLIFTEHLFERDGQFHFEESLLEKLRKNNFKVIPTGRISGAA
ncbi:MAG: hypothetical protein MUF34_24925 [Polyangiaceae bacterium]|jgi:hypothetical protein|nr:hypothetical protein [Polyangiaceae bacterium]